MPCQHLRGVYPKRPTFERVSPKDIHAVRTSPANHKLTGFLIGAVLPLIGMIVFWGGAYGIVGLRQMGILLDEVQKLAAVISIGLLANLPAFFGFYWKKWDESARGVIMATFLYAIPIVYIKFVL